MHPGCISWSGSRKCRGGHEGEREQQRRFESMEIHSASLQ
ncbi:hypothetical protein ALP13_104079 [Pseudomonas syringae pv. maculicola]|uniref:Uncharacterized protein n=1 Tax=Pseudomonas syringae pv. maculicola TaxID=59511 RepID=A0A3M6CAN6_PSEYM|nr:hypothetical protein ALP13_104079 [Pseudomonas syringae pv. maculicola]